MTKTLSGAALILAAIAAPSAAAPGGPIGALPLGTYLCELPGDASGAAGLRVPPQDFTITHGSSYRTPEGLGTYLLTGNRVIFTSGPRKGTAFHRTGASFLRQALPGDHDGPLRCVRQGSAAR